ncbi:MAG: polysaccharide deacetylase family protein [Caldilinea sp.]|nr:polysaccharide deacetylase family protein [Caldilinea sp.]
MFYNRCRSVLLLTFDHEMCTNFPYRSSVWDHRKGAIDGETRQYLHVLNAQARELRVPLTYFVVASALEELDPGALAEAVHDGSEIANHTYSHVNVTATDPADLRGLYAQQPWLVGQRSAQAVIEDEIVAADQLLHRRLGCKVAGFRTPYGFTAGIRSQPWLGTLLVKLGYRYVSSRYAGWDLWHEARAEAGLDDARLLADLRASQPYQDPDGLWELPIVTPTDCHVFRPWRWPLDRWVQTVCRLVDLGYEHGLVVDLCCHPAILAACDPAAETVRAAVVRARSKADGVWITTPSAFVLGQEP